MEYIISYRGSRGKNLISLKILPMFHHRLDTNKFLYNISNFIIMLRDLIEQCLFPTYVNFYKKSC